LRFFHKRSVYHQLAQDLSRGKLTRELEARDQLIQWITIAKRRPCGRKRGWSPQTDAAHRFLALQWQGAARATWLVARNFRRAGAAQITRVLGGGFAQQAMRRQ
jgi:hypothetical protein